MHHKEYFIFYVAAYYILQMFTPLYYLGGHIDKSIFAFIFETIHLTL